MNEWASMPGMAIGLPPERSSPSESRMKQETFSQDATIRAARTALEFLEDDEWTGDRSLQGDTRLVVAEAHRMAGNLDGALLIRDRMVAMVGPGDRVGRSPDARRAVRLDARGKVVLPGFVDSHTHALFAAPRVEDYVARISGASYSHIARAGGGIRASASRVRSTSERVLTERLRNVARLFLEYGTTTAEVKSGYGLDLVQEMKMLRAIRAAAEGAACELVPTLLVHEIPARYTNKRARFLQLVRQKLIPQAVREGLAEFFDVFCDRGYFSLAETKGLLGSWLGRAQPEWQRASTRCRWITWIT